MATMKPLFKVFALALLAVIGAVRAADSPASEPTQAESPKSSGSAPAHSPPPAASSPPPASAAKSPAASPPKGSSSSASPAPSDDDASSSPPEGSIELSPAAAPDSEPTTADAKGGAAATSGVSMAAGVMAVVAAAGIIF